MALPRGTTGSLDPTFVPARLVSLTVKPAYALALHSEFWVLHPPAGFQSAGADLWAPPLQFRRRPPQSNYPSGRVSPPVSGGRLERQISQGSISLLPPPQPKPRFHRLLPILRRSIRYSWPECS